MDHLSEYLRLLNFMYPVFSGVTCGLLLLFSMGDSMTRTEVRIKRLTIAYLFATAFNWLGSFIFGFSPPLFPYINVLLLASYMYAQILLYWLFHILTGTKQGERFPLWHHLAPVILCGTLFIWSFLVPYDIQLQIVQSKGMVFPEGYEAYGRYFTSKPLIRLVFSVLYTSLVIIRLVRYYRRINNYPSLVRRPARWVLFLIVLMVALIIVPGVAVFTSRSVVFASLPSKVAAFAIFCQQILLSYHILRRDYMLYITFPAEEPLEGTEQKTKRETLLQTTSETVREDQNTVPAQDGQAGTLKSRKAYTRQEKPLNKRGFEAYMNKHKPFLDPEFKIADMAEALGTNRTYISNFVNKTYGVNFNRYLNRCRLRELDRLMELPSNAGKQPSDLIRKAGFSAYKHYYRAKAVENEKAGGKENNGGNVKKVSG